MSQDNGHDGLAAAARFAERAGGERGESGCGARGASGSPPDPELVERPKRRRFTAKYKLEILERAEACVRPGEIGEVLGGEGRDGRVVAARGAVHVASDGVAQAAQERGAEGARQATGAQAGRPA